VIAKVQSKAVLGVACCLAALALAAPAGAATITPTIVTDEYDNMADATCSLREAVQSANVNSDFGGCVATDLPYAMMGFGPDTIALGDGTFTLTTAPSMSTNQYGNLDIPSGGNVTISHAGPGAAAIDGGDQDSLFKNDGVLSVSGVTIQNGRHVGGGGAIFSVGSLTLRNVTLTDNETTAEGPGGAIASPAGGVSLTNVTISGNRSENGGGGIHAAGVAGISLTNVTVSGNTADNNSTGGGDGGGIWNASTVAPTLKNTIIEGNSDDSPGNEAPDCSGTLATFDHNLIGDASSPCNFAPAAGDQLGVTAGLGALGDNGGPTPTRALPLGSLAADEVPPANCASGVVDDQRGYPRPFPTGGSCDVGAYELFTCPDGSALNAPGAFPDLAGCPPPPLASVATPPARAKPAPKNCRKGFKLKRGRCKKKRK
jgi:CSLREA domain-containing protein